MEVSSERIHVGGVQKENGKFSIWDYMVFLAQIHSNIRDGNALW